MRTWRTLPDERTELYSPVGLMPKDDLTGRRPLGKLQVFLDAQQHGGWRPTDVRAVFTQGGVITYPALGRKRAPLGQPASRYRIRIDAEHYIPFYRRDHDGIEFDVFPYDDDSPPRQSPGGPTKTVLVPGPTYPFQGHLLVLRGMVVDAGGRAVSYVEVFIAGDQRTLTDARGVFALPTPRPPAPTTLQIDAANNRTGQVGGAVVQFPQDLARHIQIVIS